MQALGAFMEASQEGWLGKRFHHIFYKKVFQISEASSQPPIGFPKPKGKSLWVQALFGINFAGAWSVHGGIPGGVAGVRQGQGRGN